jgi:hypothetical protein
MKRITAAAAVMSAALILASCVPLPYKPAVKVQNKEVTQEGAPAIMLKVEPASWAGKIGDRLRRAEPRIELIDGAKALPDTPDFISLPEAIAALAKLPPGPDTPDYLLGMAPFSEKQVSGSNPDLYVFPVAGYAHGHGVGHLPLVLVELHSGRPAESMDYKTEYSMTVVQLWYGFMTVPRSEKAVEDKLVADIARRLRAAQPTGPIRLLVMFEQADEAPQAAPEAGSGK